MRIEVHHYEHGDDPLVTTHEATWFTTMDGDLLLYGKPSTPLNAAAAGWPNVGPGHGLPIAAYADHTWFRVRVVDDEPLAAPIEGEAKAEQ